MVHLYATIAFAAVIGIMLCMLKILAVVAHSQMAPRPMYLKPDKFRDYEGNQNWNWDFVLVFDIRPTDWKGTAYQRAHTLRKVIEKLKNGKLETCVREPRVAAPRRRATAGDEEERRGVGGCGRGSV